MSYKFNVFAKLNYMGVPLKKNDHVYETIEMCIFGYIFLRDRKMLGLPMEFFRCLSVLDSNGLDVECWSRTVSSRRGRGQANFRRFGEIGALRGQWFRWAADRFADVGHRKHGFIGLFGQANRMRTTKPVVLCRGRK